MGKTTSQLLMKQAPSIHVNSNFPIAGYYERAERLLRQSMIYRAGQDQFNLFVIQARFSSLLLDTIPKHKSFGQSKERYNALNKPLIRAISELESLKQILDKGSETPAERTASTSAPATAQSKVSQKRNPPSDPQSLALDDLSIGPGTGGAAGGSVQVLSDQERAELAAAATGGLSIQTSPSFLETNSGGGDMSAPVMYPSPSGAPISAPVVPKVRSSNATLQLQQQQPPPVGMASVSAPPLMHPQAPPSVHVASAPPMVSPLQGPPPPPPPLQSNSNLNGSSQANHNHNHNNSSSQLPPPPPPGPPPGPPPPPAPYQDEPQMTAHKPKVVENFPTQEVADMDYMNLADRLKHYGLKEKKVEGDGNCQFRSLSDQLFGSTDRHAEVRRMTINQLKSANDLYEPYVPEDYDEYVAKMSKDGEWGDHVTLQAAADCYGRRICVLSSYKTNFIIDIKPQKTLHPRVLWLSFWAEVHYNSLYPSSSL